MAQFKQLVDNLSASPNKKTINVAFHMIQTDDGRYGATDEQVAAQMDVLNRAYTRAGIQFRLVQFDRTSSRYWFYMYLNSPQEEAMPKALAVDPAHTFNIYSCATQDYLGWGLFPWDAPNEAHYWNSVVISTGTVPGVLPNGPNAPYNLGLTAVHETGHYLGLYHTFEGCTEPGDYCDDTPEEAEWVPAWAYGCPTAQDTCPSHGVDPVHNYMDYTDDACKHEFTRDQATRMHWALATYRPHLTLG